MQTEKERSFLIHFCYLTVILSLIYIFFHSIIYQILPFLLGFLIAFSLRPAIRHTISFLHLPQKFISFLYLLLFYGTIGTAITLLCIQCFHFLTAFLAAFPAIYDTQVAPLVTSFFAYLQQQLKDLPVETALTLRQFFTSASDSMQSMILSLSTHLFSTITAIAASLPSILVSFFITVLSSIFFTMDFPTVSSFIMRQIPHRNHTHLYLLRTIIVDTILHYLQAYGKLMIITFVELAIGLSLLHVDKAFSIALLISFFDIFPILGTGTILFPWILIAFFNHRIKFAVGLLILHLIINLLRQIIEPKIVGRQLGIHPLFMLACMFFGVKLFGLLGIFLAPILLQIVCRLNEEGILHLYK